MPPIDPSIPLQAQGAPDNSAKLMQFAQLQQMGQAQRQKQNEVREHKRISAMADRGAGLFVRYQGLKDQGFSEQAAHAAMQEDFKREIGGLASLRDDSGAPLYSQDELGQLGQEFNAGRLGSVLPQLMGAKQTLDNYFKTREMGAAEADKKAARQYQSDTLAEPRRHNAAVEGKPPEETFQNPVDEVDASGKPVRVQYGNRGTRRVIAGAQPAPKGKDGQLTVDPETGQMSYAPGVGTSLKEGEGKSVTYGVRAAAGLKKLEDLEDGGYNPGNEQDRFAANLPGGNYVMSKTGQKYAQAEREFLGAILRKDTGAAVTDGEMEFYGEQFFPRAGDSAGVIKQKRTARRTAFDALKKGSGAGAPLIPDVPPSQGKAGEIKFLGFE